MWSEWWTIVRDDRFFIVARVNGGFEDFDLLLRELGALESANQFFCLSRKHGTTHYLDPTALFRVIYGIFKKHAGYKLGGETSVAIHSINAVHAASLHVHPHR